MTPKLILIMLLGGIMLWTCQTEQVFVDRIIHDTVWVEKPPIRIIETKTDTVWQTKIVNDTVIVSQEVVVTDTVLVEKVVQLVDTVYKDVIKEVTVIELDTVYITKTEIVESRLTIVHPGTNNYDGLYHWTDAITEWMRRAEEAGRKPKAETVVFMPVRWGNPTFGIQVSKGTADDFYYVFMEYSGEVAIWRALSYVLLDIPLINLDAEDEPYGGDIYTDEKYDHLMFQFFLDSQYYEASPEKQAWYWEDMLES